MTTDGTQDPVQPFDHDRGRQHLVAAVGKACDPGDIAEHGPVCPVVTPSHDGHQAQPEPGEFLETRLVGKNVDRF